MKELFTGILLIILCSSLSGKEFPGYYVNMKGDTIQCKFDVKVNLFRKGLLNQLSFRKKIKIIEDGSAIKYKPDQVKMFQINSTSKGSEKYVPVSLEGRLWFVRVVDEGKISLYEFFYPHGYDGSVMRSYVIHKKNKSAKSISSIFWRKKLLKYLDNEEWFKGEINQAGVKYADIPEIIMNYNLEKG